MASRQSSQPALGGRPTFVCWGELLWDLFPTGPELGGSAANVAINLHRLGARPLLVSRVGRDTLGDAALHRLDSYGLDTSYIQRDATAPTGTVDVAVIDGEPMYQIAEQSAWDRIEFESRLHAQLRDVKGIVYGTLAQRTPIVQGALRQLVASRPESCWTICDLNLRPPHVDRSLVHDALSAADVVKMNEIELWRVAELLATRRAHPTNLQRLCGTCHIRNPRGTRLHPMHQVSARRSCRISAARESGRSCRRGGRVYCSTRIRDRARHRPGFDRSQSQRTCAASR